MSTSVPSMLREALVDASEETLINIAQKGSFPQQVSEAAFKQSVREFTVVAPPKTETEPTSSLSLHHIFSTVSSIFNRVVFGSVEDETKFHFIETPQDEMDEIEDMLGAERGFFKTPYIIKTKVRDCPHCGRTNTFKDVVATSFIFVCFLGFLFPALLFVLFDSWRLIDD